MSRKIFKTALECEDLLRMSDEMAEKVWPQFMLHDPIANKHWDDLYKIFPEYQFGLFDSSNDSLIAGGKLYSVKLERRDRRTS